VLQVHKALDALASADCEKALIVKLRFFVGLSHEEIAACSALTRRLCDVTGKRQGAVVSNHQGVGLIC
jgi:hypothetical protein